MLHCSHSMLFPVSDDGEGGKNTMGSPYISSIIFVTFFFGWNINNDLITIATKHDIPFRIKYTKTHWFIARPDGFSGKDFRSDYEFRIRVGKIFILKQHFIDQPQQVPW